MALLASPAAHLSAVCSRQPTWRRPCASFASPTRGLASCNLAFAFRPLLAFSASLALALSPSSALSATIKMGADEGTLVFVPTSISVAAGEKVIFLNNKGFPHNVIFEKDGVPVGVEVETISHGDYMNERGEQFVVTLKEKGTYRFFCEPHRAAGMFGEIIVT